eukprot:jgi/Mesen1/10280/ME000789S09556
MEKDALPYQQGEAPPPPLPEEPPPQEPQAPPPGGPPPLPPEQQYASATWQPPPSPQVPESAPGTTPATPPVPSVGAPSPPPGAPQYGQPYPPQAPGGGDPYAAYGGSYGYEAYNTAAAPPPVAEGGATPPPPAPEYYGGGGYDSHNNYSTYAAAAAAAAPIPPAYASQYTSYPQDSSQAPAPPPPSEPYGGAWAGYNQQQQSYDAYATYGQSHQAANGHQPPGAASGSFHQANPWGAYPQQPSAHTPPPGAKEQQQQQHLGGQVYTQQATSTIAGQSDASLSHANARQTGYQPQLGGVPRKGTGGGKFQAGGNARLARAVAYPNSLLSMGSGRGGAGVLPSPGAAAPPPAYTVVKAKEDSTQSKGSSSKIDEAADKSLQPGSFPPSLRSYVERALARCQNETQKRACQDIMKEVITRASQDGSLFSKDWDTEPLFVLPPRGPPAPPHFASLELDSAGADASSGAAGRRKKASRWEPATSASDDAAARKGAFPSQLSHDQHQHQLQTPNQNGTAASVLKDKRELAWRKARDLTLPHGYKASSPSPFKSAGGASAEGTSPHQQKMSKRKAKKLRQLGLHEGSNGSHLAEHDSDDEAGGTKLASPAKFGPSETPEERSRRQKRAKRFDAPGGGESARQAGAGGEGTKGGGRRGGNSQRGGVGVGASARRAAAFMIASKRSVEGGGASQAVEDMDWDLLTIRGTCQQIEKRYLRLTSAPDPASCQAQLKGLYGEGLPGCTSEFAAYGLLYTALHGGGSANEIRAAMAHAVALGNYCAFFRLYRSAPNLNQLLMEMHVETMRYDAVQCMAKAYRPSLPVAHIAATLAFREDAPEAPPEEGGASLHECCDWLKAHGAVLLAEDGPDPQLDAKASSGALFMPEPEDVIGHGDANLQVDDFFSRTAPAL